MTNTSCFEKDTKSAAVFAPENTSKSATAKIESVEIDKQSQTLVPHLKSDAVIVETGAHAEGQPQQKNHSVINEFLDLSIPAASTSDSTRVPGQMSNEVLTSHPLVHSDIKFCREYMLHLSSIPHAMAYDRLFEIVEKFGPIEALNFSSDRHVCEVIYKDPLSLTEAVQHLDNTVIGSEKEPQLKAKLVSRQSGTQLFVGGLTPEVTESMLEETFQKLVGSPVAAVLKRDCESLSPLGYGLLNFQSESDPNLSLVYGHRAKVGTPASASAVMSRITTCVCSTSTTASPWRS